MDGFFITENPSDINWMDVESFVKKIATEEKMLSGIYTAYKRIGSLEKSSSPTKSHLISECLKKRKLKQNQPFSIIKKLLYDDLVEFKNDLRAYLQAEDLKLSSNDRANFIKTILDSINQYDYSKDSYIINFNYTHINSLEFVEKNIHGSLNGSIVVGYDSSSAKIDDENIFELSKEWQKIGIDQSIPTGALDSIIFYGHSLGEQDYPIFFDLFNRARLGEKNSITRLFFCYSNYEKETDIIKNYDRYRIGIIKLINAYERDKNPNTNRNKLVTELETNDKLFIIEVK